MELKTYGQMKVSVLRATQEPAELIKTAMRLTQTANIESCGSLSGPQLKFLIKARHTSLLEHCSVTLSVCGVSRSLLAQLTRHRMSSFTSASQHYTDYRDMPMVVDETLFDNGDARVTVCAHDTLEDSAEGYIELVDRGVPIYEARQVLPNAAAVNLIWTVNFRSLLNFFEQRLCKRNVKEMQIFAGYTARAIEPIWPEFIDLIGPPCYTEGKCNQGKMQCKSGPIINKELDSD